MLLDKIGKAHNFTVNRICHDFLTWKPAYRYDLVVGNPPFSKLKKKTPEIIEATKDNKNQTTNNLAALFLEKCMR